MNNIFDYMDSYGNTSFDDNNFNKIDALIFSKLIYFPLDEIDIKDTKNIEKTYDKLLYFIIDKEIYFNQKIRMDDIIFLKKIINCKRYNSLILKNYISKTDYEIEKQFAAITILINKKEAFISFRGTDDSVVGLKEDLNMTFMSPIPSQKEAVNYINEYGNYKKLIVGGHSKGGNLAIYGSSHANMAIKKSIECIYNYDGPGFNSSFLMSNEYQTVSDKIMTFVPEESIVGMFLDYSDKYFIIHSYSISIFEHDLYTWEIKDNDFVYKKEVSIKNKNINRKINKIISSLTTEEKEVFINSLYDLVKLTGIKKWSDFDLTSLTKVKLQNLKIRKLLFVFIINILKING